MKTQRAERKKATGGNRAARASKPKKKQARRRKRRTQPMVEILEAVADASVRIIGQLRR